MVTWPLTRLSFKMRFPFESLKRIGRYRIVNAGSRWGIDLFDDLERLANPGAFRMVFDVGANVGGMSTLFMKNFPKATIHAFEPVCSTFAKLRRALGSHPRLALHKIAASDKTGSATIRLFADPAKNTLVSDLADSFRTNPYGLERVEMCRLDSFMSAFKVDSIDLLKLDVEGFEANALRGCGENLNPARIRYIYLEFHRINKLLKTAPLAANGHSKLGELDQLLEAKGYRLLVIYTQGIHQGEPIGTYNALYGVF
jgi:FkbM family methyltransferase